MTNDDDVLSPETSEALLAQRKTGMWRRFAWLIRRELWEHRSLLVAPAAAAVLAVVAHVLATLTISDADRLAGLADPEGDDFQSLYSAATGLILITGVVVGLLYSLDALRSERRDRSILFWKSMPVSDLMTVLSKAAIPLVVLPVFTAVLVIAASLIMITLQTLAWQMRGFDPRALWAELDLVWLWSAVGYGLPFMALWNAPVFAWLLMVSAWARRMGVFWALGPIVALLVIEHTVLHQTGAHWLIERRLGGWVLEPYTVSGAGHGDAVVWIERFDQLDPLGLYTLPGLWIGVILAGLMIYAAARLRRSRPPL